MNRWSPTERRALTLALLCCMFAAGMAIGARGQRTLASPDLLSSESGDPQQLATNTPLPTVANTVTPPTIPPGSVTPIPTNTPKLDTATPSPPPESPTPTGPPPSATPIPGTPPTPTQTPAPGTASATPIPGTPSTPTPLPGTASATPTGPTPTGPTPTDGPTSTDTPGTPPTPGTPGSPTAPPPATPTGTTAPTSTPAVPPTPTICADNWQLAVWAYIDTVGKGPYDCPGCDGNFRDGDRWQAAYCPLAPLRVIITPADDPTVSLVDTYIERQHAGRKDPAGQDIRVVFALCTPPPYRVWMFTIDPPCYTICPNTPEVRLISQADYDRASGGGRKGAGRYIQEKFGYWRCGQNRTPTPSAQLSCAIHPEAERTYPDGSTSRGQNGGFEIVGTTPGSALLWYDRTNATRLPANIPAFPHYNGTLGVMQMLPQGPPGSPGSASVSNRIQMPPVAPSSSPMSVDVLWRAPGAAPGTVSFSLTGSFGGDSFEIASSEPSSPAYVPPDAWNTRSLVVTPSNSTGVQRLKLDLTANPGVEVYVDNVDLDFCYVQTTPTPTDPPTATPTPSAPPSATPTSTPVPSFTPTGTPRTPTATPTPSDTPSATPTPSDTPTPSSTPTDTPVLPPSATPTPTNTRPPTSTPVPSNTPTNTPVVPPSATPTPSNTPVPTATPTNTPVPSNTPTNTPVVPPSATPTPTNTRPPTSTPVPTATPTNTPLIPPSATPTNTPLIPPSATPTPTNTPLIPPSATPTPTNTPLIPPSATPTPTNTPLVPPSATPTSTPTNTPRPPSPTPTPTNTPGPSPTPGPTKTPGPTSPPGEPSTPEPPAYPACLRLEKYEDLDADGRRDLGEPPREGVPFEIVEWLAPPRAPLYHRRSTDADGVWEICFPYGATVEVRERLQEMGGGWTITGGLDGGRIQLLEQDTHTLVVGNAQVFVPSTGAVRARRAVRAYLAY